MTKTLKIRWLAASLRGFKGRGGTKYRFWHIGGLKSGSSEFPAQRESAKEKR